MALNPVHAPGATPLDPDEIAGLIPGFVTTQEELNLVESENILEAEAWLAGARRFDVLDDGFARALHKRMFGKTWRWAGHYRSTEKNIGIAPENVAVALRDLMADVRAQIESQAWPVPEIAARFHHRLTRIHAFANGNGRHARLMTDLLMRQCGWPPFTWGRGDLVHAGDERTAYIAALHSADQGDFAGLLAFLGASDGGEPD